jgi:DNA mismatch endonuclease (patch repair protein)
MEEVCQKGQHAVTRLTLADVLTPQQRRLNMQRIGPRDTRPELFVRRGLHRRGLRFRLHVLNLPGKPDLVFAKYNVAVFVHGCFWHGHDCDLSKTPATNLDFWRTKIRKNVQRDRHLTTQLHSLGWRVLVIWECAMRGPNRSDPAQLIEICARFIKRSKKHHLILRGSIAR